MNAAEEKCDPNLPATAWEYGQFLMTCQRSKISGLEATCRELEAKLAAHRGALVDAHRDLARFEAYSIKLSCGERLPDFELS